MQIRHKLLLWFAGLVSVLLLAFSAYVYVSYAEFRTQGFAQRLVRKAELLYQVLDDARVNEALATLPEQAGYIYSPTDQLVYASPNAGDYHPSAAFLAEVRQQGRVAFDFTSPDHIYSKEGVALTFRRPSEPGRYLAIVTAYDNAGLTREHTLLRTLLYGYLGAVVLVAGLGLVFARWALLPFNRLISQLRRPGVTQPFRLQPLHQHDEAGELAAAFNGLLARQEALAQSQQAFIAQASHELRTPLTTIKGWLETSLAYDADVSSLREGIRQAAQELDKLTALANGLLHLAHLEGLDTHLERQPLELMDLLLDVIDTVQHQRPAQRLALTVGEGVQQQTSAPVVLGNNHLLRTAITNLVDNACKYSDGQPVALRLEMHTDLAIRLTIEDRGIGIAPADAERIFQPLTRGSNSQQVSGFGIGLTLARQIVQLHRGQLWLRPRSGGGTVAEVGLPLVREAGSTDL
ncbi:HAMP domain-containing sensor histidine kinase [Hymenobacter sp. BT559]|uniref:sensor histidine kinase n=1 Tax=Hymenobacter sp. BT559 TaxID=2795729 RepID=UPI0018EBFBAE|nr:HAMP domain-containing sensor histidine kinase [Hymenobacter sp. BT559]MBJ6144529.1 HAMP domain-containing histidine kinase [Hymenobacter sp. BT559]